MKLGKVAIVLALLTVLLLFMMPLWGGQVKDCERIIGDSQLYTEEEISEIMDAITANFMLDFAGCTMTELKYDEEFSLRRAEEYAQQYGADEAIVLTSSFDVDSLGGDGSFTPNSTYTNWQWILVRSAGGGWKLQTCGY